MAHTSPQPSEETSQLHFPFNNSSLNCMQQGLARTPMGGTLNLVR